MYPQWTWKLFKSIKCCKCKNQLSPFDIEQIGIEENTQMAVSTDPKLSLLAVCRKCGQRHRIWEYQPIEDVIRAMRIFYSLNKHYGEHGDLRKKPPPRTPISDKEVKTFLNRLNRTSFKRSSKGFQQWMKDLGAPLIMPDEGPDDNPFSSVDA